MAVEKRLMHYASFDTQSSEESTSAPSTEKQLVLARELKKECESLEGVVSQYDTYLDTHFQMDVLECLKEKLQEKLRLDLFMLVEIHQFQFNL